VKIGNRMAAIAALVPKSRCVADIGTDHAYLPTYLVTEGIAERAVAGDIHKGPYLSAIQTVKMLGLDEKISVRLGDGLAVLTPNEADVGIIAGMGGTTIAGILSARPEITNNFTLLVLQPMSTASYLRRWLVENEWEIVDEVLVTEDGIIYEIIVAQPGCSAKYQSLMYDIGPVLWAKRHPLLKEHLTLKADNIKSVLAQMQASSEAINSLKYREYQEKLAQLEDKIACL